MRHSFFKQESLPIDPPAGLAQTQYIPIDLLVLASYVYKMVICYFFSIIAPSLRPILLRHVRAPQLNPVGLEELLQSLVAPLRHHIQLLLRPRIHRDGAHEGEAYTHSSMHARAEVAYQDSIGEARPSGCRRPTFKAGSISGISLEVFEHVGSHLRGLHFL